MTIVIDASVTLAWLLGETDSAEACIRQSQRDGASAPAIWLYETLNGLAVATRRKRITVHNRATLVALVAQLDVDLDAPHGLSDFTVVEALASAHGLTAYDAAYLLLAKRRGATLASLDSDLRAAARKEKIALLPA